MIRRESQRRRPSTFNASLVVLTMVVLGLILYPLCTLLVRLFVVDGSLSLEPVGRAIREPVLATVIRNTAVLVIGSGLAAIVIGAVLAWLSERSDAGLGWAMSVVPLVPLLLPPLAGAIGWVFLLSPRAGLLNTLWRAAFDRSASSGPLDIFTLPGLMVVTTIYLVPYAYLVVSSALRNLDASFEEASRLCGAGIVRTITRVSLPAVAPALTSATILVLIMGIALFSVPAIIGTTAHIDVLSVLIFRVVNFYTPPRIDEAIALSVLALFAVQFGLVAQWFTGRIPRFQTIAGRGFRGDRTEMGIWRWPARVLIMLYLLVAGVLPLIALGLVSLEHFWSANIDPAELTLRNYEYVFLVNPNILASLRNSLALGIAGALIGMSVAASVSYYSQRSRGVVTRLVDTVGSLPGTVPHIVFGLGFLIAFSQPPLVLYGTTALLLIAYITIYMPQAMQSARAAFAQVAPELSEASRVAGASEAKTFVRIVVPLIFPSLLSGALILAVLMLGEVNASVLLATIKSPVIGPTLFDLWDQGTYPPVAAISVAIVVLNSLVAIVALRVGRIFVQARLG